MLAAENLGKRYANRWIFRGLRFEVERGQRLVVLGRNGSGKSTLLRTLAGLIPPTEGQVRVPDGDTRLTLGYSGLEMALYPQLSVDEHLEFAASVRGCDSRCRELLDFVGLPASASVPASQLSTGMKARLKLALAVQANPQVLILDEPGASLDEAGRELVDRIVSEQTERGCLILATNDPSERRHATHEFALDE